jgi:hypothetical protein
MLPFRVEVVFCLFQMSIQEQPKSWQATIRVFYVFLLPLAAVFANVSLVGAVYELRE